VRLTLMLEAMFAEAPGASDDGMDEDEDEDEPLTPAVPRYEDRVTVFLALNGAIETENRCDIERMERLRSEARERLFDRESDIMQRPIGEALAILCRDFGLAYDPSQWPAMSAMIIEAAERVAASPGAPRPRGWTHPRPGPAPAGRSQPP
jgi:hypothetical protein